MNRRGFLTGVGAAACAVALTAVPAVTHASVVESTRLILFSKKFDYYVDSVNGNDSNSGKFRGAPLQSLAAVVTAVGTKTYQRIGFAGGSSWKEQFVLTNNAGTSVKAYGSRALPLIDGSDAIANGSFSLAAAQVLTYTAAITVTGTTGTEQRLVWENGKCLTQVTSIANCESTAGSFFFDSYSASSANVYVHASDGSNVTSNGKLYEFTKRYSCLNITGDNCVVTNIRTRRQRDNSGSMQLNGDYGWMIGCSIEDGHKHNALTREGGGFDGCAFKNCYNGTAGSPNFIVFNKNAGAGLGITVRNCSFLQDSAVVPVSTGSGVTAHVNASGNFGVLTGFNNTFTNILSAYAPTEITTLNASNDTFLNCLSIGSSGTAGTFNFADFNYTINSAIPGNPSGTFSSANPASGRIVVNYLRGVWNTGTFYYGLTTGNNADVTYTNCTAVCGISVQFPVGGLRITGTGVTLTVNGTSMNIGTNAPGFYNLAADTVYVGDNNTFTKGLTGNYRWQRAGVDVANNAVAATAMAAWRTYSSQDANSVCN